MAREHNTGQDNKYEGRLLTMVIMILVVVMMVVVVILYRSDVMDVVELMRMISSSGNRLGHSHV